MCIYLQACSCRYQIGCMLITAAFNIVLQALDLIPVGKFAKLIGEALTAGMSQSDRPISQV